MAKPFSLTHLSFLLTRPRLTPSSKFLFQFPSSSKSNPIPFSLSRPLSTNRTPYPLQYELIINRPVNSPTRRRPVRRNDSETQPLSEPDEPVEPTSELGLDSWVDRKLASESEMDRPGSPKLELDKAKRKYYNKRRKRMFGSDSDDETRRPEEKFVELKPEVVELPTLHRREEELYFYDTFAYPWEKDKHYKMVYQLEKKYFPDQCLDKAFLEPGQSNESGNEGGSVKGKGRRKGGGVRREKKDGVDDDDDEKLVFFEEKREEKEKGGGDLVKGNVSKDIREKKVEEFFKGLRKVPNKDGEVGNANGEPYLSSRRSGLPPVWDGPHGTVVLVNKPKGWTSFTVCGKLRRIVKVKKISRDDQGL